MSTTAPQLPLPSDSAPEEQVPAPEHQQQPEEPAPAADEQGAGEEHAGAEGQEGEDAPKVEGADSADQEADQDVSEIGQILLAMTTGN